MLNACNILIPKEFASRRRHAKGFSFLISLARGHYDDAHKNSVHRRQQRVQEKFAQLNEDETVKSERTFHNQEIAYTWIEIKCEQEESDFRQKPRHEVKR